MTPELLLTYTQNNNNNNNKKIRFTSQLCLCIFKHFSNPRATQ